MIRFVIAVALHIINVVHYPRLREIIRTYMTAILINHPRSNPLPLASSSLRTSLLKTTAVPRPLVISASRPPRQFHQDYPRTCSETLTICSGGFHKPRPVYRNGAKSAAQNQRTAVACPFLSHASSRFSVGSDLRGGVASFDIRQFDVTFI